MATVFAHISIALVSCVFTCLLGARPLGAQEVSFRWHHFGDNSGTQVSTTTLDATQPFGDQAATLGLSYSLDRVSMPAIKGVPGSDEQLDAITQASRPVSGINHESDNYEKERHQLEGSATAGEFTGRGYVSLEEDWRAHQLGLSWSRDVRADHTTLALAASYGWDDITPLDNQGTAVANDARQNWAVVGSAAQIINARTRARLSAEFGQTHGYQANPYRSVRTTASSVSERHPRRRARTALSGDLLRYFNTQSSVRLHYRYYSDDWRVASHTGQLEVNQRLGERATLRYRYRYYTQTAAYFYRPTYASVAGVGGFLSADYKLDQVTANLFGVKLGVPLVDWLRLDHVLAAVDWTLRVERYYTHTDFAASILETGFDVVF